MISLNIRILLVFVLILTGFVEEYVIAGTQGVTQGQDLNVLENIRTINEQITALQGRQKILETVSSSPISTTLMKIESYTNAIWFLLVLLVVAVVAAIIIISLVSFLVIPHSISNLIPHLTSNFGHNSPLSNLAIRLQEVAIKVGDPLDKVAAQLQDVASSTGPLTKVADQLHEVVNNLSPISSFPIITNQLPVITSNLNTLTAVASQLQVIAHNLNNLANNLDTKSHLDNMVTQLQKIAVKP